MPSRAVGPPKPPLTIAWRPLPGGRVEHGEGLGTVERWNDEANDEWAKAWSVCCQVPRQVHPRQELEGVTPETIKG